MGLLVILTDFTRSMAPDVTGLTHRVTKKRELYLLWGRKEPIFVQWQAATVLVFLAASWLGL
jgi:hypothetical protein